jgi:two-component system nitrogen regulation response regulator GlnG
MPKLLLIDDEPNVRFSIAQVFAHDDIQIIEAETASAGLRLMQEQSPDVILLDIRLRDCSGLDLFRQLRDRDPKCLVIFITGHGTAETAIEAMKIGAYDYLVKPLDARRLHNLVEQAFVISRLMHVPALVEETERAADKPDRFIGSGPAMQTICKQIGRVAAQNVNVLILGESGTGKELVARALYHHSQRSQAPFLAINCAAIPESLLESELFGHERGAFTGADQRRIGKFEQCHGGTLFLDEVGDMSLGTQARILRLLQEGRFERVGGNETLSCDVRVLAATNQHLDKLMEEGRFRKDLFYRLRGVTLHLPPLRERREDVPELAYYFLYRLNRQLGASVQSISEAALEILQEYDWPGNVRELQNVIRESVIASAGPTLLPEFLPVELQRSKSAYEPRHSETHVAGLDWPGVASLVQDLIQARESGVYRRALEHFDRLLISCAMDRTGGHLAQAADILGISRPTLRAKLRSLKLALHKTLTPTECDERVRGAAE